MDRQTGISLATLTTFRVGGPARWLCRVKNEEELRNAIAFAAQEEQAIFIVGGGSNVLFSDEGFDGVVIKNEVAGISSRDSENDAVLVTAGAGVVWDTLVAETVTHNLWGLENLSYIPGTVGASPVQNVGAYGREAADMIEYVETIDMRTMQPRTFRRGECAFDYRDSFFKTPGGRHYCIMRVTFRLTRLPVPDLSYRDVQEYFASRKITEPSLREIRAAIGEIRAAKFPDLAVCGTAGSFFKNPVLSRKEAGNLGKRYPDMPLFLLSDGRAKVPLAWILDHLCGMKGTREGNVGSFHRQPLVIVNYGSATASDIKAFTQKIERDVYARTGITIVPEVVYA